MKKFKLNLFTILVISASVILVACSKKDDPSPSSSNNNNNGGSTHFTGDTEGSVTIDGTSTAVSGGSTNSVYGFVMTPRNMTPANSYPAFDTAPIPLIQIILHRFLLAIPTLTMMNILHYQAALLLQ